MIQKIEVGYRRENGSRVIIGLLVGRLDGFLFIIEFLFGCFDVAYNLYNLELQVVILGEGFGLEFEVFLDGLSQSRSVVNGVVRIQGIDIKNCFFLVRGKIINGRINLVNEKVLKVEFLFVCFNLCYNFVWGLFCVYFFWSFF